jgi:hypothetical protein
VKQRLTIRRQFHQHFTMILIPMAASHRSLIHETIHKFHRGVMAEAKSLCESSHCGTIPLRQALDCQEKLVLLWLDPQGTGRLFAEMKEPPDLVPELGKLSKSFV